MHHSSSKQELIQSKGNFWTAGKMNWHLLSFWLTLADECNSSHTSTVINRNVWKSEWFINTENNIVNQTSKMSFNIESADTENVA